MILTSKSESDSVFRDGRIKPGIYKIQNVVGQTYVDIRDHNRELCGRPVTTLEGKGLVGSCPHLVHIVVIPVISSGKSSLLGPDIPSAGYSVETHFVTTAVSERRNIARTRKA